MTQFEIYRHGIYINSVDSEEALKQWMKNNVAVQSDVTGELKATQASTLAGLLKDAKEAGYGIRKLEHNEEWL